MEMRLWMIVLFSIYPHFLSWRNGITRKLIQILIVSLASINTTVRSMPAKYIFIRNKSKTIKYV